MVEQQLPRSGLSCTVVAGPREGALLPRAVQLRAFPARARARAASERAPAPARPGRRKPGLGPIRGRTARAEEVRVAAKETSHGPGFSELSG